MSSRTTVLCYYGISLICGVFLFFLWYNALGGSGERFVAAGANDGYAILIVDESEDDWGIREMFTRGGMGEIISESSQFVAIDDFGSFRQIPLVSFYDEIEPFDPRNDGYAEKLHSFFVNNGKRYFFTPLESSPPDLRSRLNASLAGTSFSLVMLEQRQSLFPYFLLMAAAGIAALILSGSKRLFLFQIPVFLSIGWGGFAAMILAAAFAGIWELLREPLKELITSWYSRREASTQRITFYAGTGLRGIVERLRPYRLNVLLASLFFLLLPVLAIAAFLPPIPLLAACVCFFLLYFLSFKAMEAGFRNTRHIPFMPVPLLPLRTKTFSLFPFLIPFVLASLLALILPAFLTGERDDIPDRENIMDQSYFVSAADYYSHIDFQRSFSYRPMNTANDALNQEGYQRYYLGDDGLIAGSAVSSGTMEAEVLPFPLEKLMDFLIQYYQPPEEPALKIETANPPLKLREWILAVVILTFCCMSEFLRPGIVPGKKLPYRWDKRIAA
ncbi:MAG: hypothetical protein LBQ94_01960 [Treponema sp.]|nr:hypothetical protein [Treponema sp.]